ncbi:hypothetical protein LI90_1892 [Carbonactinospora thermoautotrophica]|uniref:Transposase IS701-like DDE domain-containing protein n=1 Tax=Carbonactinospora thermoautotrophica TaxID=1469144 RepID=A0A132MST6_9ACTN|nr:hypothetical protein LI90_1892 [Carbonactinospora thermoautotrophica]
MFALTGALLCTDGPVRTLVELALAPEHRRGHGALYGGVNRGRIDVERLRDLLAAQPLPKTADGRIVLAVDVSPWPRPDAAISPGRLFCHTWGRGRGQHQMIPGWPYPVMAARETGPHLLDRGAGRRAPRTGRRPRGRDRRPGPRRHRTPGRRRAVDAGRGGHPRRGRRRLPRAPPRVSAGRPAGRGAGAAALRPGAAQARTTPPTRHQRPSAPARRGVPLRRPAPPGTSRTPSPPHPPPATAP